MSAIKHYPTYYPSAKENAFVVSDVQYTFRYNGNVYQLDVDSNGVIKSKDELHAWNSNIHEIHMTGEISIENASRFYGKETDAVACHDAEIGIALLWTSPRSFQRGVFELGTIRNATQVQNISMNVEFPKASFRDFINVDLILYIHTPGNPNADELFFANKKGFVIGCVYSQMLLIDGIGSIFPSLYVNLGKTAPLWSLTCEWEDAYEDQWDECISLDFNRENKFFKYVNKDDSENFDYELVREIQASAIALIVEKLRNEDYPVDNMGDLPKEGSVAMVVKYMSTVHKCDFSNPMTTSNSIRRMVENQKKGAIS